MKKKKNLQLQLNSEAVEQLEVIASYLNIKKEDVLRNALTFMGLYAQLKKKGGHILLKIFSGINLKKSMWL